MNMNDEMDNNSRGFIPALKYKQIVWKFNCFILPDEKKRK